MNVRLTKEEYPEIKYPEITEKESRQNIKNTLNIRLQRETDEAKKTAIRTLIKHI